MRRGEKGQALVLALILLALVAALVVPSLRLTGTVLKNSPIVERRAKVLYAIDAAQEYILWKLMDPSYASSLAADVPVYLNFDVCGVSVNSTVIMRAVATWHGVKLAQNTPIQPTKTVTPSTVANGYTGSFTYTIKLERISDNMTQGLDAVYDLLPSYTSGSGTYGSTYYDYEPGSSRLRVDGGSWQSLADPAVVKSGGNTRLQWPATYNYSTGTGGFTSPIRDFAGGQIKEIEFRVKPSSLGNNKKYYNWVALKPWDTLSGATAPVVTGTGSGLSDGFIDSSKTTDKPFILPGITTIVTYTISVRNWQTSTDKIASITDYLPPGFEYYPSPPLYPNGMTTLDPALTYGDVNGVMRWKLVWNFSPQVSIASGATLTLTFKAITAQYISGSYFNEVLVVPNNPVPSLFSNIGITIDDFNSAYSWNSAPVIVPAYDSSSSAEGTQINANMATTAGGIVVTSWQIY